MSNAASGPVACRWLEKAAADEQPLYFSQNNKNFVLRKMKAADYPAVRALLPLVSRCQQQLEEPQLSEVLRLPTYVPFCCFAADAAPSAATAAAPGATNGCAKQELAEGRLIGFCEVYVQPHLGRAADGRLERVIVDPDYRGQGIGTAMCREVLQFAKQQLGLGRIDLTVEKENAKHIYTKLGFEPVRTETLRLQN
ncbi:acetyltransferase domain-containing protein, putative [Eimeria brunetti]|uniref:Acetyltransferase domain-containing protein, putative n=1 Tax=Eimeria brunetti TaxID=51314 RepID=U6LB28_9EIME|nr:acetyltransferase domain-containing protein, putative [Eimeria brunetti]